MEEHEHEHITIIDEEGNETLYEILFTFESEDYDKTYVLVYEADPTEGEEIEIMAFSYEEGEDEAQGELTPIESDEEWEMVEEVLNTFIDDEDSL